MVFRKAGVQGIVVGPAFTVELTHAVELGAYPDISLEVLVQRANGITGNTGVGGIEYRPVIVCINLEQTVLCAYPGIAVGIVQQGVYNIIGEGGVGGIVGSKYLCLQGNGAAKDQ